MSDIAVQASFNSGEWSPNLLARVDLTKYKSGAALLENFFVDYRGGASTRAGTQYIIQAYKSAYQVRLIPFQVSFNVGYILEFGNGYIRFIYNQQLVLESSFAITAVAKSNPCVVTVPGNNFAAGDWVLLNSIVGMTQLNGNFYSILNVAGNDITIGDLNGTPIDSTPFTTYIHGGTAARVYTIDSPYTSADDLRLIKYAGNINQMFLSHPNHPTYVLTIIQSNNWTLLPIVIGSTAVAPNNPTATSTLPPKFGGGVNYSYGVTSIDSAGQESSLSPVASLSGVVDIRTTTGSNQITWTVVQNAVAYNVYESELSYFGVVPLGVQYGFIGTCKGNTFIDSNIGPDFTETPPISKNPFIGSGISTVVVTAPGTYTAVPVATPVGTATINATLLVQLQIQGTPTLTSGGAGYVVNDVVQFGNAIFIRVLTVAAGVISTFSVTNPGAITSGSTPANPLSQTTTSGIGTGAQISPVWGVGQIIILNSGEGYITPPTVNFSSGAATATTTLSATSNGNPTVPAFFQQRLVLAGPPGAPQTFHLSQPGSYFNFDITDPVQATNAITGTLVSNVLNSIKSIVSSTAGMLILTDKASWLVNGGSPGSAISPSATVANAQSFVGSSDVPPIVANYDVLYVQSKGSGVRDLSFNIYFSVFTGTDISILSSHLFYGYTIQEWAWAEQPFYTVWAVRNDGQLLSLTFLKEQEFIGWSHHITDNGLFKSVAVVTENVANAGNVDAVYLSVQRTINGYTVQYIERMAERIFPNGARDAWCVDCAIQYSGPPASSFSGGSFLAGELVTGLADGKVITPFVMPVSGVFGLPNTPSKVTIGKGYVCKLKTLALDMGEPSVQGKVKKINSVDVRVAETLGLKIGNDFDHLTPMKDLVVGNVSSMLTGQQSQVVTDLVNGDARTFLNPTYTVPGQYCIQQDLPFPASVLGVFPTITIGDDR